ncbi:hypothetical protein E4T49_04771 [Aureobasidium sp. EXF-10728]|nr:hypothetical protein E4T49_04771 [Aureobasidium sp. EXF-10728]
MPVVKGGVWTNIEDEILKAAVSKYGLQQWARVSSLLARKTPKQCKARWSEWLDPGIRKIEWTKDEDEKLLHLAKLMPTQWRTIAPIVGRTATQCLERYQKLLDDAESRESDEFGLGGPTGGEAAAPSAEDVRKLRPGEMDPDPESKPARPDTIDMDEDEKEMLSEARARLANTQGKKAKRKARERQLEESRRLAVLQKRRELKNAGINIKVVTKKKGQMDYNADIPFEKAPAPGFYDTGEEMTTNERERDAFDPRKQQLQRKRQGDQDDNPEDRKRQKNDKGGNQAAFAAAAKAGREQKLREAERSSRRRGLVLPAPQVSEGELDDIVKMGMVGERANLQAGQSDNEATRALIGNYSDVVGSTPLRTPRAPQEEDRIANEIRNARARTETQSALLGGDNNELYEGDATTGFGGVAPSKQATATPNPMATPFRQNGIAATPRGPGATPLRTPRDTYGLNTGDGMQMIAQTPRDLRLQQNALRNDIKSKLSALPKPKEMDFELELPEEQQEIAPEIEMSEEDAARRDARNKAAQEALARAEFKRQSQVIQRGLPRPSVVDVDAMLKNAADDEDPIKSSINREMALLIANDALKFGNAKVRGTHKPTTSFTDEQVQRARLDIALEMGKDERGRALLAEGFGQAWEKAHERGMLPGLAGYAEDEVDEHQLMTEAFDNIQSRIISSAEKGNTLEQKLVKHHTGYMIRSKTLRQKINEAADFLAKTSIDVDVKRIAAAAEEAGLNERLDKIRVEPEPEDVGKDIQFTLPAISIDSETIMGSFAIAEKLASLDKEYEKKLFPQGDKSRDALKRFEEEVLPQMARGMGGMRKHIIGFVPFFLDDRGAEYFYATRERQLGKLDELRNAALEEEKEKGWKELVKAAVMPVLDFYKRLDEEAGGEGGVFAFRGKKPQVHASTTDDYLPSIADDDDAASEIVISAWNATGDKTSRETRGPATTQGDPDESNREAHSQLYGPYGGSFRKRKRSCEDSQD